MRKIFLLAAASLILATSCGQDATDTANAESETSVRTHEGGTDDVQNDRDQPTSGEAETPAAPPTDSPVLIGAVDERFPLEYFALGADDEVLLSSFSENSDGTATISLNARTQRKTQDIMSDVAKTLEEAGFSDGAVANVEGMAAQKTFSRERETITVGVVDDASSRLITIGGTIEPTDSSEK